MPGLDNKPKVTETQASVQPYAPSQGNLQDILNKANTIANDGTTFTPTFSQNTTQGLASLGQLGQQPSQTVGALQPIIQGSQAAFGVGNDQLTKTANGDYIGGNQFMDKVLANANQHTADAVNAQYSNSGRYGSGAHTTALAKQIGEQNTAALSSQYNTERGNQLSAAGNLASQGYQGAALAPQIDAAKANQVGYQIAAGQGEDANAAAKRLAPYMAAQAEAGLTVPIAGLGRTSTGNESTVQHVNPITQGVGLGMGALAMFSDERVKENITEVGKTHDGQKIYSYNYKGSPTPTLGLLAQEVEKKRPEAVGSVGGVKTVNYKAATKAAERGKTKSPSALGMLAG